jgi:hypothetical protein
MGYAVEDKSCKKIKRCSSKARTKIIWIKLKSPNEVSSIE